MSDTFRGTDRKRRAKTHYMRDHRRNEKKGWMKYNQPNDKNRTRPDKAA